MPYRVFEHTADVGVEVWGSTLKDVFRDAARAMFSLMVDSVEAREERTVELEGERLDWLLVDWLSELLYLMDAEGLVFSDFDVALERSGSKWRLRAVAKGEPYDREKHGAKMEIKAVTYHMLEMDEGARRARVLFDI